MSEGEDGSSSDTLRRKDITITVGLQCRGHQKGTGGRVDPGQHGGEQQRRRQKELDREAGVRYLLQRPTELVGHRLYIQDAMVTGSYKSGSCQNFTLSPSCPLLNNVS